MCRQDLHRKCAEAEVEQLAGQGSKPDPSRQTYRWGTERGYVVIDGQKVPVENRVSAAASMIAKSHCEATNCSSVRR